MPAFAYHPVEELIHIECVEEPENLSEELPTIVQDAKPEDFFAFPGPPPLLITFPTSS